MTALTSTSAEDLAIDISGVSKTYRTGFGRRQVHALCGIDLKVHRGGVFGLLGPNGAGKSTLVKILLTVIRPTTCRGTMLGKPIGDIAALAKVGYLPEHNKFPEYLTAAQVLDYYGALSGVDRATRHKRSTELLELVGIRNWADSRVKGFSKGMRQRLGIANALVGDPDLIILDEPTDGVDPVGRRDIRNILMHLRDEGKTVFLNSHLLSELEMVCDHVAILVQGLVSSQGTIDDLTLNTRRYDIEVAENGGAPSDLTSLLPQTLSGPDGPTPVEVIQNIVRVRTEDAQAIQPLIDALRGKGRVIKAVRPVRASLEDLFMQAVIDPTTGGVLAPGAKGGPDARSSTRPGNGRSA